MLGTSEIGAWNDSVYAFERLGSNNYPAQLIQINAQGVGQSIQMFPRRDTHTGYLNFKSMERPTDERFVRAHPTQWPNERRRG